jgi:uncharacterized protein
MRLSCSYASGRGRESSATRYVRRLFGLSREPSRRVIAENVQIAPGKGRIVLFQGPSGSGKSSLLRQAARRTRRVAALDIRDACGTRALVDSLDLPPEKALRLLARCGLGEAKLMLHRPAQLSEGQRYRFALARALAQNPNMLVADEFGSTLDRPTARVLARAVRKIADRQGVGFLLATAHDDLSDDLAPDEIVRCAPGGTVEVRRVPFAARRVYPPSSNSPKVPARTGRTSLGGITAGWASGRCDGSCCSGMRKSRSGSASSASAPCPAPRGTAPSGSGAS